MTVTVVVPVLPEVKLTGPGAVIVKFGAGGALTLNVTVAGAGDRDPLLPVIVTVLVPVVVNVQESVEDPEPVMVEGVIEQAVLSVERLTTSSNWLSGVIVMVEVPATFVFAGTGVGPAVIVNPTTWN